jgi:hypothetical protein
MVEWNRPNSAVIQISIASDTGPHLYIKNNLFINYDTLGTIIREIRSSWAGECDYNTYYSPNNTEFMRDTSGYITFPEWETNTGQDANSNNANPNLLNIPPTGATSSSGDYHLTEQSTLAIDKGVDLSSLFNDDHDGNIRTVPWDIGAYEYTGTPQQTCSALGGVDCCEGIETCPGNDLGSASDCPGICCSQTCTIPTQLDVTLTYPPTQHTSPSSTIDFICNATDPNDIESISLYGNWSGWSEKETINFANNLLNNPGFEDGFSGGVASDWTIQTDGSIIYTQQSDSGHEGSSQKIQVTSTGSWGLFYYQTPPFQLNEWYTWSFLYKTQDNIEIYAEVCSATGGNIVVNTVLPETNGQWVYKTITFQYTNTNANQLRFYTNTQGTFWIDNIQLELGQTNHSFSYTSDQTNTAATFTHTLPSGKYEWNCLGISDDETVWGEPSNRIITIQGFHRADTNQDSCIQINELLAFIDRWKISSQDVTMPEMMEAIGLWKSGSGCS